MNRSILCQLMNKGKKHWVPMMLRWISLRIRIQTLQISKMKTKMMPRIFISLTLISKSLIWAITGMSTSKMLLLIVARMMTKSCSQCNRSGLISQLLRLTQIKKSPALPRRAFWSLLVTLAFVWDKISTVVRPLRKWKTTRGLDLGVETASRSTHSNLKLQEVLP